MKSIYLIIILLFHLAVSFGQHTIRGILINQETSEKISVATIGIKNSICLSAYFTKYLTKKFIFEKT